MPTAEVETVATPADQRAGSWLAAVFPALLLTLVNVTCAITLTAAVAATPLDCEVLCGFPGLIAASSMMVVGPLAWLLGSIYSVGLILGRKFRMEGGVMLMANAGPVLALVLAWLL